MQSVKDTLRYVRLATVQGCFAMKSICFKSFRYNSKSICYTDLVDSLQPLETQKSPFDTQLKLIRYKIETWESSRNVRAFELNDGIIPQVAQP